MISIVVLISMAVFGAAYIFYGRFLKRQVKPDDSIETPAHKLNDGVDYVPAKAPLLLGQHFSAIAAAGPIVGPILAGMWFGWVPAILWIIFGAIFIGGVHDYLTLIGSVRHKAESVGEIVKRYMPGSTRIFFMLFVWLALLYVIIAFTDITAQTFKAVSQDTAYGPAVAASSIIYLLLAVIMGIGLYKFKLKLWLMTLVFLPLVLLAVWIGPRLPAGLLDFFKQIPAKQWAVFLLIYCFVASIVPMWLLLQPRGYLGGWLLYLTIFIGLIGALLGGFKIAYPAINFNVSNLESLVKKGQLVFPFLFITIACGACSGFHALVSSGTTSKQLYKESDALPIGYGALLLEGLVAILALATVMMLPKDDPTLKSDPNLIYANGISKYLGLLGVGFNVAFPFALLAFSTFVYDTLDVSTRLARYIFQELTGWKSFAGSCVATLISLSLPLVFILLTKEKAYLVAWSIFGTSNQMLASLTLLALSAWLAKSGKRTFYVIIPMIFMLTMTITALTLQIKPFIADLLSLFNGGKIKQDAMITGICGVVLLGLCIMVMFTYVRSLVLKKSVNLQAG